MKLKAYNKLNATTQINYKGHYIVRNGNGTLTLGAKHITEEQAAVINLQELSNVREWLGTDYAVEIIV